MIKPNFLIIGAAKSGTTSLYYYLKQHPQIYMSSPKEPHFFAFKDVKLDFQGPAQGINQSSITDYQSYCELFKDVKDEVAVGEASTIYLYSPIAAAQIKQHIPKVKLIAILRDPVERAYSSFSHLTRDGYETYDFIKALKAEKKRIANNWPHLWHYQQSGFYYNQVKRYFDTFDRQQIKVYLYEDINNNPLELVQNTYRFLDVEPQYVPSLTKQNVSQKPKSQLIVRLFRHDNQLKSLLKPLFPKEVRDVIRKRAIKINSVTKPSLTPEMRQSLIDIYREDVLRLQDLIQRDLSTWLV